MIKLDWPLVVQGTEKVGDSSFAENNALKVGGRTEDAKYTGVIVFSPVRFEMESLLDILRW